MNGQPQRIAVSAQHGGDKACGKRAGEQEQECRTRRLLNSRIPAYGFALLRVRRGGRDLRQRQLGSLVLPLHPGIHRNHGQEQI